MTVWILFTEAAVWKTLILLDVNILEWSLNLINKWLTLTVIFILILDVYEVCKYVGSAEAARLK